ncbi:hypothetical protein HanRHA438_Chr15g0725131 [Helianthus annuus]|nr:hypothetical protein HanIR_Chr15g0775711 [Helianthus annuus]KAJ0846463.1 hypothetical protein HanRHA438_Chr15g0725131 [Helianthus annuus]
MHLCTMPSESTKGNRSSHDFNILIEFFKLLNTVCDKNRSVLETRLSSLYSSVISNTSPAHRSGATFNGVSSILTA